MTNSDKNKLLDKLAKSYTQFHKLLEGVDLQMSIYKDADWRIRDIVGHIATWDREVAKAIRAYKEGTEYINPEYTEGENDYNQRAVLEQRKLTTEQVLEESEQAREDIIGVLKELPEDKFPGDLVYPWGGERGDIVQLVEYFIEHDIEHQTENKKILKLSKKD